MNRPLARPPGSSKSPKAPSSGYETDFLAKNPGLQSRRDEAVSEGHLDGRDRASAETDLDVDRFPPACPYSWHDITVREIKYEPRSR
jgi:hypothetical protein